VVVLPIGWKMLLPLFTVFSKAIELQFAMAL